MKVTADMQPRLSLKFISFKSFRLQTLRKMKRLAHFDSFVEW